MSQINLPPQMVKHNVSQLQERFKSKNELQLLNTGMWDLPAQEQLHQYLLPEGHHDRQEGG